MARNLDRFSAMARTAELVNTTPSPEEALTALMDLAIQTVGAERGYITLIDPESGGLTARVARNFKNGQEDMAVSRTLVHNVYRTQQPYFNTDVNADEQYRQVASVRAHALRAVMCVPLQVRGRRVGVIYLDNRIRSGAFEPDDLDFVVAFSHQAAMALDKALVADLRHEHAAAVQRQQRSAVGTLAAGMAHEINNPLGTILINAQMMAEDAQRQEDRDSIELIVDGARRAKQVVDRLLTWFRAGTEDEVTRFDLRDAVVDMLALAKCQATVEGPANLVVHQNRTSMAEVVSALLDNARLAVQGRSAPAIQVRIAAPAVIEVEDNGCGIAATVLPHIFEPFFTTRPPGQGQGLGLFVARSLLDKCGATVTVESTEGHGSLFKIAYTP